MAVLVAALLVGALGSVIAGKHAMSSPPLTGTSSLRATAHWQSVSSTESVALDFALISFNDTSPPARRLNAYQSVAVNPVCAAYAASSSNLHLLKEVSVESWAFGIALVVCIGSLLVSSYSLYQVKYGLPDGKSWKRAFLLIASAQAAVRLALYSFELWDGHYEVAPDGSADYVAQSLMQALASQLYFSALLILAEVVQAASGAKVSPSQKYLFVTAAVLVFIPPWAWLAGLQYVFTLDALPTFDIISDTVQIADVILRIAAVGISFRSVFPSKAHSPPRLRDYDRTRTAVFVLWLVGVVRTLVAVAGIVVAFYDFTLYMPHFSINPVTERLLYNWFTEHVPLIIGCVLVADAAVDTPIELPHNAFACLPENTRYDFCKCCLPAVQAATPAPVLTSIKSGSAKIAPVQNAPIEKTPSKKDLSDCEVRCNKYCNESCSKCCGKWCTFCYRWPNRTLTLFLIFTLVSNALLILYGFASVSESNGVVLGWPLGLARGTAYAVGFFDFPAAVALQCYGSLTWLRGHFSSRVLPLGEITAMHKYMAVFGVVGSIFHTVGHAYGIAAVRSQDVPADVLAICAAKYALFAQSDAVVWLTFPTSVSLITGAGMLVSLVALLVLPYALRVGYMPCESGDTRVGRDGEGNCCIGCTRRMMAAAYEMFRYPHMVFVPVLMVLLAVHGWGRLLSGPWNWPLTFAPVSAVLVLAAVDAAGRWRLRLSTPLQATAFSTINDMTSFTPVEATHRIGDNDGCAVHHTFTKRGKTEGLIMLSFPLPAGSPIRSGEVFKLQCTHAKLPNIPNARACSASARLCPCIPYNFQTHPFTAMVTAKGTPRLDGTTSESPSSESYLEFHISEITDGWTAAVADEIKKRCSGPRPKAANEWALGRPLTPLRLTRGMPYRAPSMEVSASEYSGVVIGFAGAGFTPAFSALRQLLGPRWDANVGFTNPVINQDHAADPCTLPVTVIGSPKGKGHELRVLQLLQPFFLDPHGVQRVRLCSASGSTESLEHTLQKQLQQQQQQSRQQRITAMQTGAGAQPVPPPIHLRLEGSNVRDDQTAALWKLEAAEALAPAPTFSSRLATASAISSSSRVKESVVLDEVELVINRIASAGNNSNSKPVLLFYSGPGNVEEYFRNAFIAHRKNSAIPGHRAVRYMLEIFHDE